METFEFKPALLAPVHQLDVSDQGLCLRKQGVEMNIAFADISQVRYWSMRAQSVNYHGLEFETADRRKIYLRQNISAGAGENDPLRIQYRAMMAVCLRKLAVARPDLQIQLGQKRMLQWVWLAIGLSCLIFAGGMLVILLADRGSRLMDVILPLGLMAVFGGYISWSFGPFRPPLFLAPEHIVSVLEPDDKNDQSVNSVS